MILIICMCCLIMFPGQYMLFLSVGAPIFGIGAGIWVIFQSEKNDQSKAILGVILIIISLFGLHYSFSQGMPQAAWDGMMQGLGLGGAFLR